MTKKTTKQTKKRNPNDATFRNIDALKKRVLKLEMEVGSLKHILRPKKK